MLEPGPWRHLRSLRADPPGRAKSGIRRRTFVSALEQGEQLWNAASTVDTAVSPIILFYGLTQASQALIAAHPNALQHEPKPSHGLSLSKPDFPDGKSPDLDEILVKEAGAGFVQQVAKALGHPAILTTESPLLPLLYSLAYREQILVEARHAEPLRLQESVEHNVLGQSKNLTFTLSPAPSDIVTFAPRADGLKTPINPSPSQVTEWLEDYPTLCQLGTPVDVVHLRPVFTEEDAWSLTATWATGSEMSGHERKVAIAALTDNSRSVNLVPRWSPIDGLVLPGVAGNKAVMHPLVTWWVILYSFSMLARYYPRTWMDLINPDSNDQAVLIEDILDAAKKDVPQLVLIEIVSATLHP